MSSRIALVIFGLLTLAVAVGWFAEPDTAPAYPAAEAVAYYQATPAAESASISPAAVILSCMIAGAALIGLFFFRPNTPKGPRLSETLSSTAEFVLLVDRATRRVLRNLHQELEVVLGLLQTVDQQIDRLMRIQAGQYAAQLVQHGRLVRAQQ
jgi:hypothetical protein